MKNNKKGFTIVELVIVIAVIAILASVLVPTFSGIILKAQRSADTQVVRMLNETIKTDLAGKGDDKHETMYQAVQSCINGGLSPDKIAAKSDLKIAWESTTGCFVLLDLANDVVIYPTNENTYSEYNVKGNEINYFIVTTYDNRVEEDPNFKYSVYAYGNDWPNEITIHTGFDTGSVTNIKKINYENELNNQTAIINTNSFATALSINASEDCIKHYGLSHLVTINNGYVIENSIVGRLKLTKGSLLLDKKTEVYCFMELPKDGLSSNIESINTEYEAVIYDSNVNINPSISNEIKDDLGIAHCLIKACVEHDINSMTNVVIDCKKAYHVCKTCGCSFNDSLVTTFDDSLNEVTGVISFADVTSKVTTLNCKHQMTYNCVGSCSNGGYDEYTCSNCQIQYQVSFKVGEHLWDGETHKCLRNSSSTNGFNANIFNDKKIDCYYGICNQSMHIWASDTNTEITRMTEIANQNQIKIVDFEYGVTSIGEDAFRESYYIQKVTFPQTLLTIGDYAFVNNLQLQTINLNEKLDEIKNRSFEGCSILKEIDFNKNLRIIRDCAFLDTDIREVVYPENVEYVGSSAFSITKPGQLSKIKDDKKLASISDSLIELNDYSITSTGTNQQYVFDDDTVKFTENGMTYLGTPTNRHLILLSADKSITHISTDSKYEKGKITEDTIDSQPAKVYRFYDDTKIIGDTTFSSGNLISVKLPNNIVTISSSAFLYNKKLVSVELNEGLRIIGDTAFAYCSMLTSITIPSTVEKIESFAFRDTTALQTVNLYNNDFELLGAVFTGCINLSKINYLTSGTVDNYSVDFTNHLIYKGKGENSFYTLISVCDSDKDTFEFNPNTKEIHQFAFKYCQIKGDGKGNVDGDFVIPMNIEHIGEQAFLDAFNIKTLIVENPDCVLDYASFAWMSKLENVVLPANIEYIPNQFLDSNYLTSNIVYSIEKLNYNRENNLHEIDLPNTVKFIGEKAFYCCGSNASVTKIIIPSSVVYIGDLAFHNTTKIETIIYGNSNMVVGNSVFSNCQALQNLIATSGDNLFTYDNDSAKGKIIYMKKDNNPYYYCYADAGDESITRLELNENCVEICAYACSNNDYLEVVLPNSLKYINNDGLSFGYYNYDGKTIYNLENTQLEYIGTEGFSNIEGSNVSIVFPQTLKIIGNSAFTYSLGISSLVIPKSVEIIGRGAFYNCSKLNNVVFEEDSNLKSIGQKSFYIGSNVSVGFTVKLPSSLEYIGYGAFNNVKGSVTIDCSALKEEFTSDPVFYEDWLSGIEAKNKPSFKWE